MKMDHKKARLASKRIDFSVELLRTREALITVAQAEELRRRFFEHFPHLMVWLASLGVPERVRPGTIRSRFGGQLGICFHNSGERLVTWVPRSGPDLGRPGIRVMCCCTDDPKCFRRHVRYFRRKARMLRKRRRGWA